MLKRRIKRIFALFGALPLMDRLHFLAERIRHARRNRAFLKTTNGFPLPPDEYLHETYRLSYRDYALDGAITARELVDRIRPWLQTDDADLLEWGCGVARITRHLTQLPGISRVTGADIHPGMIEWNTRHIKDVTFVRIPHEPPTPLPSEGYHAVIGVSVLTHIPAEKQQAWLMEIFRLLKPGGVFLFTTHGTAFRRLISSTEQKRLLSEGCITHAYPKAGHRMMTTLHDASWLKGWLSEYVEIACHIEGDTDLTAAGGQDLWIVRKRDVKD